MNAYSGLDAALRDLYERPGSVGPASWIVDHARTDRTGTLHVLLLAYDTIKGRAITERDQGYRDVSLPGLARRIAPELPRDEDAFEALRAYLLAVERA